MCNKLTKAMHENAYREEIVQICFPLSCHALSTRVMQIRHVGINKLSVINFCTEVLKKYIQNSCTFTQFKRLNTPCLSLDCLSLDNLKSFEDFSLLTKVGCSLSSASNRARSASKRRICLSTCCHKDYTNTLQQENTQL